VDLGVTGQDVLLEAQMETRVTQLLPLGFGKCKLQVQVPEHDAAIKTVAQLAGKRVVTSFNHLAAQFFEKVDAEAGLQGEQKTDIEYVGGSVEAACALGLADGIVDLVESGETMRAAGLHAIATVLETEAVLIAGKADSGSDMEYKRPEHATLISLVSSRIAGVLAANKYVMCEYNIPRRLLDQAAKITPGRRAPTISPLVNGEEEWVAVSVMVEKKVVADVMDGLVAMGAHDVFIVKLENCRV